jgi:hypothetical protein
MEELVTALSRPAFYGPGIHDVDLHETHISWVFVAGDRAYKVKKPVVLPFLDYGTAERRHAHCREEVRLNQRLAPDTYLGVRSIIRLADGRFELGPEDHLDAIEHVVEMRRLPNDRTLAAFVREGDVPVRLADHIGAELARFHDEAERVETGAAADLRRRLDENAATLRELLDDPADIQLAVAVERALSALARRLRPRLDEREAAGRVRECHGDLRAEHLVIDRGIQIFDCIEFDLALRTIDVGNDLAFLVMDLEDRGAGALADAIVAAYRRAGGDPGDDALLAFFAAYRAAVRAKIALLRGDGPQATRRLLRLARRLAWGAREPLVIVVCGPSAAGKTHLARALAKASGLPRLSSDVTRKRLAGLAPHERGGPELYSFEASYVTYAQLGRLAAAAVEQGAGAIVDATFRSEDHRAVFLAELGRRSERLVLFVECRAAADVMVQRAQRRLADPARESDAGPDLSLSQLALFEPLDEVPATQHVVLRTERPVGQLIDELEEIVDERAEAQTPSAALSASMAAPPAAAP